MGAAKTKIRKIIKTPFADKKKEVLGYQQRIIFSEALELIGYWLRYRRLIP